ncbi:hypothetical protein ACFXHA_43995 [Nocardia sp. NPDC059240]|uniref:hypothetical protein n=1 Tax=Nocardia sp. NPDC059240 TaxID=3346786 RepID=UPI0036CCBA24
MTTPQVPHGPADGGPGLGALQSLSGALTGLREAVGSIPIPPRRQLLLTYETVIAWLADHRPSGGTAVRGAVMRGPTPRGRIRVDVVFLDASNSIVNGPDGRPCGGQFVVDVLDDELSESFGTQRLFLVD